MQSSCVVDGDDLTSGRLLAVSGSDGGLCEAHFFFIHLGIDT